MKHICLFAAALFLLSCQEELSSDTNSLADFTPSGDTVIFYLQPGVDAFSLPACAGYYNCPAMEHIDIDCDAQQLLASSRSAIFYPLQCINAQDTTNIVVMISGIAYPQGNYCSGSGENSEPVYYGNGNVVPQGSAFDLPPSGMPSARSQGLAIDPNTGKIDIDQSVMNGIFGKIPQPGVQRIFRIYYRLNDQSKFTLNFIDLSFELVIPNESARAADVCGPGNGGVIIVKEIL
jgi:hypothetical protein